MKVLLVGINAKYIHSNLAIRTLAGYAKERVPPEVRIEQAEFTIHDNLGYMLGEINDAAPDIVGFSCYIWNIETVRKLASAVKKILPDTQVVMGGPEVSFGTGEEFADIVVAGEGEQAFVNILTGKKHQTEKLPPTDFAFPYTASTLPANKIIYYEASRGCPFSCGFCLSHTEKPVRLLPVERVCREMQFFLDNRVNQVKFVDRTFNCDRPRAHEIWRFLIERDNGHTNFHFEVAAHLLDGQSIEILRAAPVGLFQFEVGVQSTHAPALAAIGRDADTPRALENIRKLRTAAPNIHIHADLIAGLPQEGCARFRRSFNDVYATAPDMLQLGFLKLLKGSTLREQAQEHGIIFHDYPPYEVISTADISYVEIKTLKDIAHAVDMLYNSGNFAKTLACLLPCFAAPFDFYESFARFWKKGGYHRAAHSQAAVYKIVYDFVQGSGLTSHADGNPPAHLLDCLRYDYYASGNQKSPPAWLEPAPDKEKIAALYKTTNTPRRHVIARFNFGGGEVFLRFAHAGKARPGAQGRRVVVEGL